MDEIFVQIISFILSFIINLLFFSGPVILLIVFLVRAVLRRKKAKNVRAETVVIRKSLGEEIKENRARCGLTQEFVAETLGISRQAVSKWENGTSDPSTSNLIALAKLFGVSAEELLKGVRAS